jgi:predicted protein tyrosine phosphatase
MTQHPGRQIKTRGFRRDTPGLLFTGWPTHIILISGSERRQTFPSELQIALELVDERRILRLEFDDTARPRDADAPTIEHVAGIVEFARSLPDDCRLLSVCPGGFGRSAAASWISLITWGLAPDRALDKVLADQHLATPNRLMIAQADVLLNLRGRLWRSYAEWMHAAGISYDPPVPLKGKAAARLRARAASPKAGEP